MTEPIVTGKTPVPPHERADYHTALKRPAWSCHLVVYAMLQHNWEQSAQWDALNWHLVFYSEQTYGSCLLLNQM